MSTSTISNTIKDGSGTAIPSVVVRARLIRGSFRVDDDSEIAGYETTTSNGAGYWSLNLERQSNIRPDASYWEISEEIPDAQGGPKQWAVVVPASASSLVDALANPLPTPTPPTPPLPPANGDYQVATIALRNAITSMVTGSLCWVTLVDRIYWYDGTAWQAITDLDYFHVADYGAANNGTTNDASAFQQAHNAAPAWGRSVVKFGNNHVIGSTIAVSKDSMEFSCTGNDAGGTGSLNFTGTGAAFEIGTDNGAAYDANDYSGPGLFKLVNTSLVYTGSATTALTNGQGNYGTSTYGIRSWRGGSVTLRNVTIHNFQYAFWGIASDFNVWDQTKFAFNKYGFYLGPRCDQFTSIKHYSIFNDYSGDIDGAWNATFHDAAFVDDGDETIVPLKIRAAWSRGTHNIVFDNCWFEHLNVVGNYPAFVDLSTGPFDVDDITFNRPVILSTAPGGSAKYTASFARIGAATRVKIIDPQGEFWHIDNLVESVGATNPEIEIVWNYAYASITTAIFDNGAGTPKVTQDVIGNSNRTVTLPAGGTYTIVAPTVVVGDGATATNHVVNGGAGTNRQVVISSGGAFRWIIRGTNDAEAGANSGTWFALLGRADDGSALSTVFQAKRTGEWAFGGAAPVATPNITGARGGNAALTDLLTKGALRGLWTDGTTA